MRPGRPYRVVVRVPPAHVEAIRRAHGDAGQRALLLDVERRVEALGFASALACMEDATDPTLFVVIARAASTSPARADPLATIVGLEEVDEPPAPLMAPPGTLDPGLSADEIGAVRRALGSDDTPRQLRGFADSLSPYYPSAASFLRARAALLEHADARRRGEALQTNLAEHARTLAHVSRAYADLPRDRIDAHLAPAHPRTSDMIAAALRETLPRGERWSEVEASLARLDAGREATWSRAGRRRAAEHAVGSLGSGRPETVEAARMTAGAEPRTPFGRLLASLGWPRRYDRTRGATVRDRAEDLASAGEEAKRSGRTVDEVLAARRRSALAAHASAAGGAAADVVADEVRRVASLATADPTAARDVIDRMPPAVRDAATISLSEARDGIWLVHGPEATRALLPGGREGFVSPTALQLVLASQKPAWSGVASRERVREKLAGLEGGSGADPRQLLRARHQMERAEKAIDRRRWVEWHRRDAELDRAGS